eukprot:498187-Amorphochlora_amoeboformis.AAC.1
MFVGQLSPEFEKKGLTCLNECGVDPGLDHMSAKKVVTKSTARKYLKCPPPQSQYHGNPSYIFHMRVRRSPRFGVRTLLTDRPLGFDPKTGRGDWLLYMYLYTCYQPLHTTILSAVATRSPGPLTE